MEKKVLRTYVMITFICLGETIPIRLFLGGFDLTPTFREVNKKYSTRYYLSLVLIDEGKPFSKLVTHTPIDPTMNVPMLCEWAGPRRWLSLGNRGPTCMSPAFFYLIQNILRMLFRFSRRP